MVNLNKSNKNQFPPLLHLTYDLQQVSDKNLLSLGIGLGQVRILSVLHVSSAHSQRTVSLLLHQTEANVSRQLQSLKRKGLVTISKNKKDGRQRDVKLTAKGAKSLAASLKTLAEQQNRMMKLVGTKDRKTFEQIVGNISKSSSRL